MSGVSPTVTEREARLRERAAFLAGAKKALEVAQYGGFPWDGAEVTAEGRYPLPKVTRPRVITENSGISYSVILYGARSVIQFRYPKSDLWMSTIPESFTIDAVRAAIWADLLANPTEEVEVDE
jgi:hypothetical protein